MTDYYSPNEIHGAGTVEQLIYFLLPNLNDLRAGTYPSDPREVGRPGFHAASNAAFVKGAEIAAEIDFRMAKIGLASIALELRYTDGLLTRDVARKCHWDEDYCEEEIGFMLRYISGNRCKVQGYPAWKALVIHRRAKKQFLLQGA